MNFIPIIQFLKNVELTTSKFEVKTKRRIIKRGNIKKESVKCMSFEDIELNQKSDKSLLEQISKILEHIPDLEN